MTISSVFASAFVARHSVCCGGREIRGGRGPPDKYLRICACATADKPDVTLSNNGLPARGEWVWLAFIMRCESWWCSGLNIACPKASGSGLSARKVRLDEFPQRAVHIVLLDKALALIQLFTQAFRISIS